MRVKKIIFGKSPDKFIMKTASQILHRLKRTVFHFNQKRIENIIQSRQGSQDFFFIQVGSNDGISGDPLHEFIVRYRWKGILVEPVPYLYEKLLATYRDQHGLIFENVAIDNAAGEKRFYYLRRARGAGHAVWYERIGSFHKEHLLKHRGKIPDFDRLLVEENVKCATLKALLQKYAVTNINLLHVDAEGYDYEIIKTVPFDEIKPRMILYENKHLSATDKAACKQLLKSHGYKLIKSKDTFAYLE